MIMTLKTDSRAASDSQTETFALPKSDYVDLLRTSSSSSPLDDQALLDGCAGSGDFLTLMLGVFQSNAESCLDEIEQEVEAGDSDAVAAAAKKLKSAAEAVAAESLRALASTLEQFCSLMDRETLERVVQRLREETNRCLDHIPLLVATAQLEV